MAWARVDDQFTDHIKVISLSLGARGMWLSGLVYAARRSTDGFIPASLPRRESGEEDPQPYVDALIEAGLWRRVEGGYQIHDYLEYNPSKADADAKREQVRNARSEAGKRGSESRWNGNDPDSESQTDSKPIANDMANDWQADSPVPVTPSRNPLPVSPKPGPKPKGTYTADFERWWSVWPKKGDTKRTAFDRWERLTDEEHCLARDALPKWLPYWATIENRLIPDASTWLNQARWENEPPPIQPRAPAANGRVIDLDRAAEELKRKIGMQ